ncbi:MAG: hypothetical protein KKA07_12840 [Bacteroidetes bacterium]|nr:hypothetical protein [Bacteroidota bacterium]MBU1719944.1 hypothetical protein [Bacteroidota bacterium]
MKLLLSILLFILSLNCNAQSDTATFHPTDCYLQLKKDHKTKLHFFKGDEIIFYSNDINYEGIIDSIGIDFLIIKKEKILLSNIQSIVLKKKSLKYKEDSGMLILSGTFFLLMDISNRALNGERMELSRNICILSGAAYTAAFLLQIASNRTFRIGKKYRLNTICY